MVDGGRKRIIKDEVFREISYCLKCGACMYVCPMYRVAGRYFGGEIYMGGVGTLLSYFTSEDKAKVVPAVFLCLECDRCLQICPMKIDTPKLMARLKRKIIKEG